MIKVNRHQLDHCDHAQSVCQWATSTLKSSFAQCSAASPGTSCQNICGEWVSSMYWGAVLKFVSQGPLFKPAPSRHKKISVDIRLRRFFQAMFCFAETLGAAFPRFWFSPRKGCQAHSIDMSKKPSPSLIDNHLRNVSNVRKLVDMQMVSRSFIVVLWLNLWCVAHNKPGLTPSC